MRQMELDAADFMSIKCEVEKLIATDQVQVYDVQLDPGDLEWCRYWADTNGKELKMELIEAAGKDESDEVRRMKVLKKVPLQQRLDETGKALILLRWSDRNKKDE